MYMQIIYSPRLPYFKLNVWCQWCRCELLIYDCLWKRIRCWQDLHHHIHKFFHSYPILFCSWSDIVLNVKVVFSYFNFDVTENGVYHVTNSMLTKEVENDGLVRPDFVNNNILLYNILLNFLCHSVGYSQFVIIILYFLLMRFYSVIMIKFIYCDYFVLYFTQNLM